MYRKAAVVVAVAGCAACQASSSPGVGSISIGISELVVEIALVAGIVALAGAVWGAVRWEGRWRLAAVIPLAVLVLWGLRDAYDLAVEPTSHNFLPLEFALAAVVIVPYMIVVAILRRMRRKR